MPRIFAIATSPSCVGWTGAAFVAALAGCGGLASAVTDAPRPDAGQSDPAADAGTSDPGSAATAPDASLGLAPIDAGVVISPVDAAAFPFPATYAAHTVAAPINGGTEVGFFSFDPSAGLAPEGALTLSASGCGSLAFDAQRNLYVACSAGADTSAQPSEVLVFANGSWKGTAPSRVLTAPLIGASALGGIALDSAGNVYVTAASVAGDDAGSFDGAIVVFGPSSDSALIRVIQALGAGLEDVNGIAIDSSDDVWVLCPDRSPLWEFGAQATGRVTPTQVLPSPALDLPDFGAIASGVAGRLWLTSSNRIAWYGTTPTATYGGDTDGAGPVAIAADDVGDVFVLTDTGDIQAFAGATVTASTGSEPVPGATFSWPPLDGSTAIAVSP